MQLGMGWGLCRVAKEFPYSRFESLLLSVDGTTIGAKSTERLTEHSWRNDYRSRVDEMTIGEKDLKEKRHSAILLKLCQYIQIHGNKMPYLYRFSEAETKKAIYFCSRHFGRQRDYLEKEVSVVTSTKAFRLEGRGLLYITCTRTAGIGSPDIRDVEFMSRVRHHNLDPLTGFCVESDNHFLVYEYCYNGNLKDHLLNLAVILQVLTGRGVVNLDFHALDQLIQMAKDVVVMGKGGLSDFMDLQLLKHKELLIFYFKFMESNLPPWSLCVAKASISSFGNGHGSPSAG
ncbi:hypothetical protein Sjap_021966 [Stephania japonica]|uniref:Serine-threonine/tyrosine-protein kinase catalytic domain-containing protein n=1 Tax=Stephania japonica TaxID=461633 RepID=A0AAP0END6_9MAGN